MKAANFSFFHLDSIAGIIYMYSWLEQDLRPADQITFTRSFSGVAIIDSCLRSLLSLRILQQLWAVGPC